MGISCLLREKNEILILGVVLIVCILTGVFMGVEWTLYLGGIVPKEHPERYSEHLKFFISGILINSVLSTLIAQNPWKREDLHLMLPLYPLLFLGDLIFISHLDLFYLILTFMVSHIILIRRNLQGLFGYAQELPIIPIILPTWTHIAYLFPYFGFLI